MHGRTGIATLSGSTGLMNLSDKIQNVCFRAGMGNVSPADPVYPAVYVPFAAGSRVWDSLRRFHGRPSACAEENARCRFRSAKHALAGDHCQLSSSAFFRIAAGPWKLPEHVFCRLGRQSSGDGPSHRVVRAHSSPAAHLLQPEQDGRVDLAHDQRHAAGGTGGFDRDDRSGPRTVRI